MALQTVFGVGTLVAIPNGVSNPTPIPFGILQDVSIDMSYEVKELYGSSQFPVDIGRGKGKIGATAKVGAVDPSFFNQVFFGGTLTGGETRASIAEAGAIPTTPFQITAANGATFVQDLGVWNATTGRFMTRVASGPATGQYSVSNIGVYLFATADTGQNVQINYTYTVATATGVGSTVAVTNTLMGNAPPTTKLILSNRRSTTGKQQVLTLNSVTCTSLKLALKNDDFMLSDLAFTAYDDGLGGVLSFSANGTN